MHFLQTMMGGKWYDEYIGDKTASDPEKLLNIAVNELRKHINVDKYPSKYKISVLKVSLSD